MPMKQIKKNERNFIQEKYVAQKLLKDFKNTLKVTQLESKLEYD